MQQGMFHAGEGQFREMERPFLTENQLRAMPKMTGMLYGFGLAKRVQVSPMSYGDWPEITPAPPIPEASKTHKDEEQVATAAIGATYEPVKTKALPAAKSPEDNASVDANKQVTNTEEATTESATELDNLI
jgi:hypothetical protein